MALTHAAQHGGVPIAARQLAAEDTPHATLDAPDTVHADAFFGSQHRGGVQTVMSNPHDASDVSHAFINASVQTASQMDNTRELTADGAPHHCAPAAAGGAPHP